MNLAVNGLTKIIFGTGNKGRMLLRVFNAHQEGQNAVHCFVDNDSTKWGTEIEGCRVKEPAYLLTLPLHSFIVYVAVGPAYPEVRDMLKSYGLMEHEDFVDSSISPKRLSEIDVDFQRICSRIKGYTLLSHERLHLLHQFAQASAHLDGEAAEVGVYRGGTAFLLASVFCPRNKILRLFDTFQGIPAVSDGIDLHREGDFSDTILDDVAKFLEEFDNTVFHPGVFPSSTRTEAASAKYSFVHVDADIYSSVLASCEFFQPRLVSGGMMLFDDYGFPTCPGVMKAVNEYFADKLQKPVYLPTGQALIINT